MNSTDTQGPRPAEFDGNEITYWSVYEQRYRTDIAVPDRELAGMPEVERDRCIEWMRELGTAE